MGFDELLWPTQSSQEMTLMPRCWAFIQDGTSASASFADTANASTRLRNQLSWFDLNLTFCTVVEVGSCYKIFSTSLTLFLLLLRRGYAVQKSQCLTPFHWVNATRDLIFCRHLRYQSKTSSRKQQRIGVWFEFIFSLIFPTRRSSSKHEFVDRDAVYCFCSFYNWSKRHPCRFVQTSLFLWLSIVVL